MVVGLTPSCFCYVSKIREDNERGKEKEKEKEKVQDGRERQSARKGKEERETQ